MSSILSRADAQTYADVLTCAAKLLAWKAAQTMRRSPMDSDNLLRSAAQCIILSDEYAAMASGQS